MTVEVVTFGETMILFNPGESGSLKYVNQFTKQIGGAESNFAIGLAHLGIRAGWISRLGNDSLGDYMEALIRGEGVDVSRVKRDPEYPTGLMIKERKDLGESKVYYYRKNSAASRLSPADLDEEYLSQAKYLHITGITPALSSSCREAVYHAIKIARANGLQVTFDPNLRLKLWPRQEMRRVILDLCRSVDIVLPGLSEGQLLFQKEEQDEILDEFLKLGPDVVVMKTGAEGAVVATQDSREKVAGYPVERIVDPIGAGDGFAAGFVTGLLKGYSLVESVQLANAVGAFALTVKGDIEGLPTWDELQVFLGQAEEIGR